MQHQILFQPLYALLRVFREQGETVRAESGAMVSMSDTITVEAKMQGGLLSSLKRSVLGGESLFLSTFRAENGPGEVTFAPTLPGDIIELDLNGDGWYAQNGAYLASTEGITIDTKFGGLKTLLGGEGAFLLKLIGSGKLFLSSYGGIYTVDLQPDQRYVVDTGHMVAFTDSTNYTLKKAAKSWKSTLFSGEGLVFEFTGPGRVLIQTRNFW